MNAEKLEQFPPPPGVLGSLRAGFDAVASHVWLILLPVLFDSFLWLGTRLSAAKVFSMFTAFILDVVNRRPLSAQDEKSFTDFMDGLARFNWLSLMRTLPVGIPSLEVSSFPSDSSLQTPLGLPEVVYVDSIWSLLGWTGFLILTGWIGGSLYFRWVSITVLGAEEAGIGIARAIFQTIVISVVWMICLLVVLIPILLVVGLAGLVSLSLANGLFFVILLLSYWLVVPFFFMPHGIFAHRQNALHSLYSSVRMSRFTLPTSGLFVFTAFLLTRGLNFLWSVPENDTWMKLVGISGHAFISTTLLAASFVYYRDMNAWLQTVFAQLQQKQGVPTQQA
jgi:hypothetical protein